MPITSVQSAALDSDRFAPPSSATISLGVGHQFGARAGQPHAAAAAIEQRHSQLALERADLF